MSELINELTSLGCDMEGTMERFLNNEELFFKCLGKALNDKSFKELGTSLEEKNCETGFDHAHNLKGLIANMGLTPMLDEIVKIVEPLRNKEFNDGLLEHYGAMMKEHEKIREISDKYSTMKNN